MSFDTPTLVWCLAVPLAIALVGVLVCWKIETQSTGAVDRQSLCSILLASAWWIAVSLGLLASNSLDLSLFHPDEFWAALSWPMLAAVILVSPHAAMPLRDAPGLWVIVGMVATCAAALCMPTGESWSDMVPLHQPWIAAVTIAAIANTWALHRMSHRGADRWLPLVILASLACPTIIGASDYSALVQTCLAATMATLVIAVASAIRLTKVPVAVVFPAMLFCAVMIAAGRFYSYDDIPPRVYGLALFAPSLIGLADRLVSDQPVVVRVLVAFVTASSIVGWLAYRFLG